MSQAEVFQLGRAVEETIRSISNTLERFHQSFFLYRNPPSFNAVLASSRILAIFVKLTIFVNLTIFVILTIFVALAQS